MRIPVIAYSHAGEEWAGVICITDGGFQVSMNGTSAYIERDRSRRRKRD
jgi:hypothetical protein